MALISLRQLLDHAAENDYGMPAFNVNNMEQVHAIMQAADEANSPVIMQGSAGARSYAGEPFLRHLISAAIEMYPHIPVVMHQDHGSEPAVCLRSIQSGFSSVMMDGSLMADMKTPGSFEYNTSVTAEVVKMAHAGGVSVEGELGCLGSLADFVAATNVDALAIAIGTSHGAYKFTKEPTGEVLRIDRIEEIHAKLPNTHLVMHGSSSVPQEWLKIINDFGGDMKQTYGVPVEEIVKGIKSGVRKVNIDTDLRMASTGSIRRHLKENPSNFDPRKFYKEATNAMKEICKARFEAFGAAGNADKIKVKSLEEMIGFYK
jgi:fructose-bisphosphate aldolase class II